MSATESDARAATAATGEHDGRLKVLVKEQVGDSGVALLREHFDVDLGIDWSDEELAEKIGAYHGILIRSATKMTAELIDQAANLRAIGRAGVGVDNVDVAAATARGIVVANAPESNVVTAAEHTLAMLLALARNIPQAHASLTSGKWERSKFSGVELYEKTLGILGFGRIGQLVAHRARGFGMRVLAFDPFVSAERYRELGVEKAASGEEVCEQADFLTIHLPKTPETEGWLNAQRFAKMRDGVRILNVARGGLIDDAALQAALDSGKVAGAALDVFPSEPITDHPLFHGYPNVIVTPHLGASTAEATDRAGFQSAEQVVAALTGGVVSTAVNIPSVGAEDMEMLAPFLPLATRLGRLAMELAAGSSVERIEAAFMGRIADFDTRMLSLAVVCGALEGRTEQQVNLVNALTVAQQREGGGRRHRHRPQPRPPPGRGPGSPPHDRAHPVRHRLPLRRPPGHDRPRRHHLRLPRHQHLLRRHRPHPGHPIRGAGHPIRGAGHPIRGAGGVLGWKRPRRDGRHDRRSRARRGRR
jgi:D-3-phosphoglycerate dehydrogenase